MNIKVTINVHHYYHQEPPDEPAPSPGVAPTLAELLKEGYTRAEGIKAPKTLLNYQTAMRSMQAYLADHPEAPLAAATMQGYERWLRDHGVGLNTISCYMRSVRSLLQQSGQAQRADIGSIFQPVYTGNARTAKRSAPPGVIARLRALDLPAGSPLAFARDIFLFSFYAMGMPFADVAFLRREQVADGRIVYYRHKTGHRVAVSLEPEMNAIIDRYATPQGHYVFPILTHTNTEAAAQEYLRRLSQYNRQLRRLSQRVGSPLTSYVVRHTWASTAYRANVALPVISKALGHTSPQTTMTYIREIEDSGLFEANRDIIRSVF